MISAPAHHSCSSDRTLFVRPSVLHHRHVPLLVHMFMHTPFSFFFFVFILDGCQPKAMANIEELFAESAHADALRVLHFLYSHPQATATCLVAVGRCTNEAKRGGGQTRKRACLCNWRCYLGLLTFCLRMSHVCACVCAHVFVFRTRKGRATCLHVVQIRCCTLFCLGSFLPTLTKATELY